MSGPGPAAQLDRRTFTGASFVSGSRVVLVGDGQLEPGSVARALMVFTTERGSKGVERVGCIAGNFTVHAHAVAGDAVLVPLFEGDSNMASIAKVAFR